MEITLTHIAVIIGIIGGIITIVVFFRNTKRENVQDALSATSVDTDQNLKIQELSSLYKVLEKSVDGLKKGNMASMKAVTDLKVLEQKVSNLESKVSDGQENLKERIHALSDQLQAQQEQTAHRLDGMMELLQKLLNLGG